MRVPIIQMSSTSKRFGRQPVLEALDWQVMPGQVVGLLGRNGAGKSTLLECLLGLRETDGGSVTVHRRAACLPGRPHGLILSALCAAPARYPPRDAGLR